MIVHLPYPDPRLNPNKRHHWRAVASVKAAAKRDAYVLTLAAMGRSWAAPEAPRVAITFYPPDRRPRDLDNMLASMKAALDGVRDAIGIDDSRWTLAISRGETVRGGRVDVEVSA